MNKTGGWAPAIVSPPQNPFSKFLAAVTISESAHRTLLLFLHPTWNINDSCSPQERSVPGRREHRSPCLTTAAPGKLSCERDWSGGRVGQDGCVDGVVVGGAQYSMPACCCPSIKAGVCERGCFNATLIKWLDVVFNVLCEDLFVQN